MTRRIVTGHTADGRSAVVQDGPSPRSHAYVHIPGFASALLWATDAKTSVPYDGSDPTPGVTDFVPQPGETRLIRVVFPPDSVYFSPGFDGPAAAAEQLAASPGLAEKFEPDNPGMHTTDTVDYGVLLSGEVVLELDDGATCHVYVDDAHADRLTPPGEVEDEMLDFTAAPRRAHSRLSCQIPLTADLDGLVVHLPECQV